MMIRTFRIPLYCLAVSLLPSITQAAVSPIVVRVGVNNLPLPPFIMGEGDSFPSDPGLSIELVKLVTKTCHATVTLSRLPSQRMLQELKSGELDALLLLSYRPERAKFAMYPLRGGQPDSRARVTRLTYRFYVDAQHPIEWDGKKIAHLNQPVGAIFGWSVVDDLTSTGLSVETTPDFKSNIAKLKSGRIAAFAVQSALADAYLANDPTVIAVEPPIAEKDYFMPFSQMFYRQHPSTVACIWREIAQSRDTFFKQRQATYQQSLIK